MSRERPILLSAPMVRAILDGRKTQTRRIVTDLRVVPRRKVAADPMPGQNVGDLVAVAPPHRYRAGIGRAGAVFAELGDEGKLGLKPGEFDFVCPYADGRTYIDDGRWRIDVAPDQRLWVRETFCIAAPGEGYHLAGVPEPWRPRSDAGRWAYYAATDSDVANVADEGRSPWKPSIHMPRWASRLTLEVVAVRVERLQSITEADARAEGVRISDAATAKQATVDVHGMTPYRGAFASLWDSINGHRAPWSTDPWVWVVEFRAVRP